MGDRYLKSAAQTVMAKELRRSESHPSPGELTGYHARNLGNLDQDRVRRHLAICPECASAVLDMAGFPDVGTKDPGEEISDEELSRKWQEEMLPKLQEIDRKRQQ